MKNLVTAIMVLALLYLLTVSANIQTGTLRTFFGEEKADMWMSPLAAAIGFLLAKFGLTIAGTYKVANRRLSAGYMMIGGSVLISIGESLLIGLHGQEMDGESWKYYTFSYTIVLATILMEFALSNLYGVETEPEKEPETKVEKRVETTTGTSVKRTGKTGGKSDIEARVKEAAMLPENQDPESGKAIVTRVAKQVGCSRPTARKYLEG